MAQTAVNSYVITVQEHMCAFVLVAINWTAMASHAQVYHANNNYSIIDFTIERSK